MTTPSNLSLEDLRAALGVFSQQRILVMGDVMLDRFITGSVDRISPEAPVPVVRVTNEELYPGGAANVARNLVPFSKEVQVCGVVGKDEAGKLLQENLSNASIQTDLLQSVDELPTIRKTRIVAQNQQIVRIDHEEPLGLDSNHRTVLLDQLGQALEEVDALILEDYAKGLFDAALVGEILKIAKNSGTLVTVDPHPSNPLDWRTAGVVKPNRKEAFEAAGVVDRQPDADPMDDPNLLEVGKILLDRWETKHLLVTLGAGGMMLFQPGADPHHIPTRAREVFDVSGAGDTAIALLTLGLSADLDPHQAAEIANLASGVVVGKLGTASLNSDELIDAQKDE